MHRDLREFVTSQWEIMFFFLIFFLLDQILQNYLFDPGMYEKKIY
jgi:hypothetical protein